MDRADIQAFLAVARYGTISKAADKLYVSHSTLSWRINRLEEELGVELFSRGKGLKKVELTKAGSVFLPYSEKLLAIWQEGINAIGKATESSLSVVIGHNHNLLFNNVYKEFSVMYPKVPLYLLLRHSSDAYEYVKSGEMDAGFVAVMYPTDKVRSIPLCKEPFVLVCGGKSAYADRDVLGPEDLRPENEIKWWTVPSGVAEWQEKWLHTEPNWVIQDDTYTMESLLDDSDRWTVVPLSTAEIFASHRKGGILVKELNFECPGRDIFVITKSDTKPSPVLQNFLEIVQRDFTARGIEWLYGNSGS